MRCTIWGVEGTGAPLCTLRIAVRCIKGIQFEEDMAEDLRGELEKMVGPVQWEVLKPHASRDAVVVVNAQLDLVAVGEAIAADNTQAVSRWINEQLIVKPTAEQLSDWNAKNKQLKSLIVQPYVLVQDSLTASAEQDKS